MNDTALPPDGRAPTRPAIDDRIAERRREVRRERQLARRRRTVRVVVAVVVLALLVVIERSPLVGLDDVEVVGVDRLTEAEVLAAADLELGTSTLRLGLGRVEARVAELPLVSSASARRLDPLRVRITVSERQPVLVARGGGDEVLLDRGGVVIAPADGSVAAPEDLTEIVLPEAPPAPGDAGVDGSPIAGAVAAWRGLSGPLRAEVVRITADAGADLTLDLRSGVEVRFGPPVRLDEKVRALGAVLEDVGATEVSAIDVRAPTRPAVVP